MDVNDQKPRNTIEDMRSIYSTIENKLITLLNTEMYSNLSKSAEEWKSVQLGLIKRSQVNNKISNYLSNVARGLKLANSNVSNSLNINTKALEKESKNALKLLAVSGKNYYKHSVNKTYSLAKIKDLKYAILEQAKEGFDKGLAVPTKSGRLYEYKSYMEMRTRTAISTEITNQQLEVNKIAKNVFFICSSFEDCAEDHADYQGKVYYDERFVNFGFDKERLAQIEKAIRSNKMLSIQQVMNNKPYLTTRPNCRHRFVPITLEQALGNTTSLLKKLHLYTGKYDDKKYKMSQDLRYCERNIRAYKDMAENFATMGLKQPNQSVEAMTKYYTKLAEEWQLRARGLVKMAKNSGYDLERDYERETRKTIIQDLGAKYFNNPYKKADKRRERKLPPLPPPIEENEDIVIKKNKTQLTTEPIYNDKHLIINTNFLNKEDAYPKGMLTSNDNTNIYKILEGINPPEDVAFILNNLTSINPNVSMNNNLVQRGEFDPDTNIIKISGVFDFKDKDNKLNRRVQATMLHELMHALDFAHALRKGEQDDIIFTSIFQVARASKFGAFSSSKSKNNPFLDIAKRFDKVFKSYKENPSRYKEAIDKMDEYYIETTKISAEEFRKLDTFIDNSQEFLDYKAQRDLVSSLSRNSAKFSKERDKLIELTNKKDKFIAERMKQTKKAIEIRRDELEYGNGYFQDIIDAVSSGKVLDYGIGGGHGGKYYRNAENKQEETLANYFALKALREDKKIALLKKHFPDLMEVCDDYFDLFVKTLKEKGFD